MPARFLANSNKKEIHDLENEKTGENQCQISEIKPQHRIPLFTIQMVEYYIKHNGYNGCKWCMPKYHTD